MIYYEVGGSVRDSLMGRRHSDTDMTAVIEASDWDLHGLNRASAHPFDVLLADLAVRGFRVVRPDRQFVTAKAIPPNGFEFAGRLIAGPVDFVLARKDGKTSDFRRPDSVTPGTLQDDLERRDFTVNAIARDSAGTLIDDHGGVRDVGNRELRCVGRPFDRLYEDRLRILRALRFCVTHKLCITSDLGRAIDDVMLRADPLHGVSEERLREELTKMFSVDVASSVRMLTKYNLLNELFRGRLWLKPTLEAK